MTSEGVMSTTVHSTAASTATTDHRGIIAFVAIAFGLAWLPSVPALFGSDPFGLILMPIAPAIAAVVVRRWVTREGFGDSGLRPNLRRWPLYLLALTWPVATTLLSILLAWVLRLTPGGFGLPWGKEAPELPTLLGWMLLPLVAAPIFFGEELGWRGYLQVRLLANRPVHAAIATGLIWGVWHYPMILTGGQRTESRWLMLALFPLVAVVLSLFFGWLRAVTGDVWAGSVAHAANNGMENDWHRLAFTGRTDGVTSRSADLVLIVTEAVVLVGIVAMHRLRRSHRPLAPGWVPGFQLTPSGRNKRGGDMAEGGTATS
jgi:membrane protease YdiL (CAAX protease family)